MSRAACPTEVKAGRRLLSSAPSPPPRPSRRLPCSGPSNHQAPSTRLPQRWLPPGPGLPLPLFHPAPVCCCPPTRGRLRPARRASPGERPAGPSRCLGTGAPASAVSATVQAPRVRRAGSQRAGAARVGSGGPRGWKAPPGGVTPGPREPRRTLARGEVSAHPRRQGAPRGEGGTAAGPSPDAGPKGGRYPGARLPAPVRPAGRPQLPSPGLGLVGPPLEGAEQPRGGQGPPGTPRGEAPGTPAGGGRRAKQAEAVQ